MFFSQEEHLLETRFVSEGCFIKYRNKLKNCMIKNFCSCNYDSLNILLFFPQLFLLQALTTTHLDYFKLNFLPLAPMRLLKWHFSSVSKMARVKIDLINLTLEFFRASSLAIGEILRSSTCHIRLFIF